MSIEIKNRTIQGLIILAALIVIVAVTITLSAFLVTQPPTAREAAYRNELQNKINQLPSEWTLRKTLANEIARVEHLFISLYQRCV